MNWGNVPQWITAVVAVLTLIGINRLMKLKKIAAGVATMAAVSVVAIGIIVLLLLSDTLPGTARFITVVQEVGETIVGKNEECVREGAEKVVATLVNYRTDSTTVRNNVYRDALEQTRKGKGGYIDRIEGRYLIPDNWKKNKDPLLLTEDERKVIQECLTAEDIEQEDLFSFMYFVLSDASMMAELERPGAYDVEFYKPNRIIGNNTTLEEDEKAEMWVTVPVATKRTIRHLTPFEKIAIVGAYIDELRDKQTQKLSDELPKSVP